MLKLTGEAVVGFGCSLDWEFRLLEEAVEFFS